MSMFCVQVEYFPVTQSIVTVFWAYRHTILDVVINMFSNIKVCIKTEDLSFGLKRAIHKKVSSCKH